MNISQIRHTGFFQQVRQALPNCISWNSVKSAFSSLTGSFKTQSTPLMDRQVAPFDVNSVRKELFPEGIPEKIGSSALLRKCKNGFEFVEHNTQAFYFDHPEQLSKHLVEKTGQTAFWEVEVEGTGRTFYQYWDEVEETLVHFPSKQMLLFAMARDTGGAFKVTETASGKTTFVRDCSGYFTLSFREYESEALFLESIQRESKRKAFRLKCLAGLTAGAAVGAGAFAWYASRQTTKDSTAVAHPQRNFTKASITSPSFHGALVALSNITLMEEIPYQSKEWIIGDIFGNSMNGATVSASSLPKGLSIVNQPMRVVNPQAININGKILAIRDNILYNFYSSNFDPNIEIIDISDPKFLRTINKIYPFNSRIIEIAGGIIEGNYSYWRINDRKSHAFLHVIDIRSFQTLSVTLINNHTTGLVTNKIVAYGESVSTFSSVNNKGLYLLSYNFNNKRSPQLQRKLLISPLNGINYPKMVSCGNGCLVISYGFGSSTPPTLKISILDSNDVQTDINIPNLVIGISDLYASNLYFTASERYLFVAYNKGDASNYDGVFSIFDISERTNPRLISTTPLLLSVFQGSVEKDKDLLYIFTNGVFHIFDISDVLKPTLVNYGFFAGVDVYNGIVHGDYYFFRDIITRGNTLSFSGTPDGGTQGRYPVILTATNQQGEVSKATVNLEVKPVIAVQLAIPDQFVAVESSFNFFVPSNTFKHINNNLLTFSVYPKPDWLRFNTNSGSFSGTPAPQDAGLLKLKISAHDGQGATASTELNLRVVNGPKLNLPIMEQVAKVGKFFSYTFPADTFVNKDGGKMQYSATNSGVALPTWLTFDPDQRRFYGTPTGSYAGKLQIVLTAKIDSGFAAGTTFQINVANGPSFSNPIKTQIAKIGAPFSFTFPSETFTSLDGVPITYMATTNTSQPLPSWILQFSSAFRTFSGFPLGSDLGIVPIKLVAEDPNGLTAETQFQIKVVHGPEAQRPISNQVIKVNDDFSFIIPADAFIQKDGGRLAYSVTNNGLPLPPWLHFDPDTRTISGKPSGEDIGTIQVVVQAKDSNGLIAETYFQIQVSMPIPLTLANPIANQIALVGQFFKLYIPANTFMASPGLTINYFAKLSDGSPLPGWLAFVNETFAGKPGRGDTDYFTDRVLEVALTARAGAGIGTHTFNINVSGTSYAELAVNIASPIFSVLGVGFAIYKKRAIILNRWNKKKFIKPASVAIIGQSFSRELNVPSRDVRAVLAFQNGKLLPNNGKLPSGFKYNNFTNAIESNKVPRPGALKAITIRVIGDADKILEEFDLNIASNLRQVSIDAKEPNNKKKALMQVQMDDLSAALLSE